MSKASIETITLSQAKAIIKAMAHKESLLFLSPPGVGKSDTIAQAAEEAGLPCRSLLGTQIAPEDVSGVPRIVGDRSVFCPPRVLLPEKPEPFCLFLDELPATAPDVQKSFYSLLLERRIGEYQLPEGTWVVAAGNRLEDRALVRSMSSALINRVIILNVRVDVKEWLIWADTHNIRREIIAFITFSPQSLMRAVPAEPVPFSTPRAWVSLSQAMDLATSAGILDPNINRALAFGRLSAEDAAIFCAVVEAKIQYPRPTIEYIINPELLPQENTSLWFVLSQIRASVKTQELLMDLSEFDDYLDDSQELINQFLRSLPQEHCLALLVDLVREWGELGAEQVLFDTLKQVTGLSGELNYSNIDRRPDYY